MKKQILFSLLIFGSTAFLAAMEKFPDNKHDEMNTCSILFGDPENENLREANSTSQQNQNTIVNEAEQWFKDHILCSCINPISFGPLKEEALFYMDMGKGLRATVINNAFAFKTDAKCVWYNRIFNTGTHLNPYTLSQVKEFMNNSKKRFGWWVNSSQQNVAEELTDAGFRNISQDGHQEHAMSANLTEDLISGFENLDSSIRVEKIDPLNSDKLDLWLKTSAAGFDLNAVDQDIFLSYIFENAFVNNVSLYIGYLNGMPASTCMAINHPQNGFMSLHLVSTIKDYRNQGVGTSISLQALSDAFKAGMKEAILLSSAIAHSLYEKLGFTDYETYDVYVWDGSDKI